MRFNLPDNQAQENGHSAANDDAINKLAPRPRTFYYKYHCPPDPNRPLNIQLGLEEALDLLDNVTTPDDIQYSARCPAHGDSNNSLSLCCNEDGVLLVTCHAGCEFEDVIAALHERLQQAENGTPRAQTWDEVADAARERKPTRSAEEWAALAGQFEFTGRSKIQGLADELGVSHEALQRLVVGWSEVADAYTFPEHNAVGEVIGITERYADGKKKAMYGSARGLILPQGWQELEGPVLLPEGASDVAAALTMGLCAIGRPSATGGLRELVALLRQVPDDREIIVLGERDQKPDGKWPGRKGARRLAGKLQDNLRRPVTWALPPDDAKDLRTWFVAKTPFSDAADLGRQFLHGLEKKCPPAERPIESVKIETPRVRTETVDDKPRFSPISTPVLLRSKFQHEWLVEGVLVANQPAVVGGPKKALKSSITTDLALAIGGGRKFLGYFDVPKKRRVLVMNGESGAATVQETVRRILFPADIPVDKTDMGDNVAWETSLPRLNDDEDLEELGQLIREQRYEVVIIDPLYLCLLSSGRDLQASNLYDIGPLLQRVSSACLDNGATPILVHHFRKVGPSTEPPELDELAFAGIAEFARQWALLKRRETYDPETGVHKIWLSCGGSAGFAGLYAVDVNEGRLGRDFSGRQWNVTVRTAGEQIRTDVVEKEKRKQAEGREKLQQVKDQILVHLKTSPQGETKNQLKAFVSPHSMLTAALNALEVEGLVSRSVMTKSSGATGKATYPCYIVTAPAT